MLQPVLSTRPKEALPRYLSLCQQHGANPEVVVQAATESLAHLGGTHQRRVLTEHTVALMARWYASIASGAPDWTVYDGDAYLGELWACWVAYSRSYLRSMQAAHLLPGQQPLMAALGQVQHIADLGCGIGYTTAALREIFPSAVVYGTNLDRTRQMQIARTMALQHRFLMTSSLTAIPAPVDLVFASEYFEHFPAPVDHLRDVLRVLQPRALLIANAFTARAIGHFPTYLIEGQPLAGRLTAREFNRTLVGAGYRKIKTSLWNNRPTLWLQTAR